MTAGCGSFGFTVKREPQCCSHLCEAGELQDMVVNNLIYLEFYSLKINNNSTSLEINKTKGLFQMALSQLESSFVTMQLNI